MHQGLEAMSEKGLVVRLYSDLGAMVVDLGSSLVIRAAFSSAG